MLNEALTAVAAAGGTAVVQAAGTDVWTVVRSRVAALLGRDNNAQQTVLVRLDRTASELEQARESDDAQLIRLEEAWRTRFEDFLEDLPAETREDAAQTLRDIAALGALGRGNTSAGTRGLAVGRDLHVQAQHGAVAGGVLNIEGSLNLANPRSPGAGQG
ncbi:hypothetical protein FNV65_26985 [Streptomyces sp. S1A1-8]|nr:hypothetical protein FNV65_26985 [Streptomyces sp. S1A1-8]QDO31236.1 hypothetical protein FNV63_27005 [Streptomyces sp. S1A1-3]